MNIKVFQLVIKNHNYLVYGSNIDDLINIMNIIQLRFDDIRVTPISPTQNIIKVWKIGELKDFLNI
jgi:hypothetical protein